MKLNFCSFLFLPLLFSCKAKDTTESDLKNAMQIYLYSQVNNDSSSVKYHVESVVYYDDKSRNKYDCEFTVHLKEKLFDTTGIMKAYISRDFKTVKRTY